MTSFIASPRLLASRRSLGAGQTTLSAVAIRLLAGCDSTAADKAMAVNPGGDVDILNSALSLEYHAIAAYQVGAESGLLRNPVLDLAVQFQGDHKRHAQLLTTTITKLGSTPAISTMERGDDAIGHRGVIVARRFYELAASSGFAQTATAVGRETWVGSIGRCRGGQAMAPEGDRRRRRRSPLAIGEVAERVVQSAPVTLCDREVSGV